MKRTLFLTTIMALLCLLNLSAINIVNVGVTGVNLNNPDLELALYDYVELDASILPAEATNQNLRWESTLENKISVDQSGYVTAIEDGEAYIIVTTEDGGFKDSVKVTCKIADAANVNKVAIEGQKFVTFKKDISIISVYVPFGTDITNLDAVLQVSPGATISPDPSTITDFTNGVNFSIVSPDQTVTNNWFLEVLTMPDLKEATEYTLKFDDSTLPSDFISEETTWLDNNLKLHLTYKDNTHDYLSAGTYSGALGLYPARLVIDAKHDKGSKIEAVAISYGEYCGKGCTDVIFYQNGQEVGYNLPYSGSYEVFLVPDSPVDSMSFSSSESEFRKVTVWLDKVAVIEDPNFSPVAIAGKDTTVYKGEYLSLNGSLSYDTDNDQLSFAWITPKDIYPTDTTQAQIYFSLPTEVVDTSFQFILEVNDGEVSAFDTVMVFINQNNRKPIADAGFDMQGPEGEMAYLMGHYSYDIDGDTLYLSWLSPSIITLDNTTALEPSFAIPKVKKDTTVTFYLTVSDGVDSDIDTFLFTITNVNEAPVAQISGDTIFSELSKVTLDASVSTDSDDNPLSYSWHLAKELTLVGSDSAVAAEFVVPEVLADSVVDAYLVVSDSEYSDTLFFALHVVNVNKTPIAIASATADGLEGDTIYLSGNESYDPEGSELTYLWTCVNVDLYNVETDNATCILPEVKNDSIIECFLNVYDNEEAVGVDTVFIAVKNVNKKPIAIIDSLAIKDHVFTINRIDSFYISALNSFDPDASELHYNWEIEGADLIAGSNMESSLILNAKWVALEGYYNGKLTVSDGELDSTLNFIVRVKYENHQPKAIAGNDMNAFEEDTIYLAGSAFDNDQDKISYNWLSLDGAEVHNTSSAQPQVILPAVDEITPYRFQLVVSDGTVASYPDTVKVTAYPVKAFVKVKVRIDGWVIDPTLFCLSLYKKEGDKWLIKNPDVFQRFEDMSFYLMEAGEWIFNVIPASDTLDFISTYYGDVIDWENAKSITIKASEENEVVINCQPEKLVADGEGLINGIVHKVGIQLRATSVLEEINDDIMADVRVLLYSADKDELLSSTISDAQGYFEFAKLPEGRYYIEIELPGYDQAKSTEISLSAADEEPAAFDFSVDEDNRQITDVDEDTVVEFSIYPNPVNDILNISTTDNNGYECTVEVIDITGKVVLSNALLKDRCHVNMSALESGIYILRISSNYETLYISKVSKY